MKFMDYRFPALIISCVLLVAFIPHKPLSAQRISPDIKPPEAGSDDKASSEGQSGRIIPPEEFGKFQGQKRRRKISQDALIEKLRADSASMRVRFQEKLRRIRSDSQEMRSRIKKLSKRLSSLRKQVQELRKKSRNTEANEKKTNNRERKISTVTPNPDKTDTKIASSKPKSKSNQEADVQKKTNQQENQQLSKQRDRSDTPDETSKVVNKQTKEKKDESEKSTSSTKRRGEQKSKKSRKSDTGVKKTEKPEEKEEKKDESVSESQDDKSSDAAKTVSSESLNPNRASMRELRAIPGIDKLLAERIIWYRSEVKLFRKKQDLIRVPGIGRSLYNQIQSYFIDGPYR